MKKILRLTLKKKWFDLIASGEKGYELREDKPFWQARLLETDGSLRDYDEIHATNGYGPQFPFLRVEYLAPYRLTQQAAQEFAVHGEKIAGGQFVICLGSILEVRR